MYYRDSLKKIVSVAFLFGVFLTSFGNAASANKSLTQQERIEITAKLIPIITMLLSENSSADTTAPEKPILITNVPTTTTNKTMVVEIEGEIGTKVYVNSIEAGTIDATGKATISLTFINGNNQINITLKDNAGNESAALIVNVTYTDATSPTVTGRLPDSNASNVSIDANMTAYFSESILSSTINTNNVTLRDHLDRLVPVTVTYDDSNQSTTLKSIDVLKILSPYSVYLSTDITDIAGNRLIGGYQWQFTTQDGLWDTSEVRHDNNDSNRYLASIDVQVAMDAKGDMIMAWSEERYNLSSNSKLLSIYVKNYARGAGWSAPVVYNTSDISSGNGSIGLAMNSGGDALLIWTNSGYPFAARYNASTKQWSSTPTQLSTTLSYLSVGTDRIKLADNGDGIFYAKAYSGEGAYPYLFTYTALSDNWSFVQLSSLSIYQYSISDAEIDENSTIHLLFRDDPGFNAYPKRLAYSTYDANNGLGSLSYIDYLSSNISETGSADWSSSSKTEDLLVTKDGEKGVLWVRKTNPSAGNTDKNAIIFTPFSKSTQSWSVPYLLDSRTNTSGDVRLASDAHNHIMCAWKVAEVNATTGREDSIISTRRYNTQTDSWEATVDHSANATVTSQKLYMDETGNGIVYYVKENIGNTSTNSGVSLYTLNALRYNASTQQWSSSEQLTQDASDFDYDVSISHTLGKAAVVYKVDTTTSSFNKVFTKTFGY